MRIDESTTPYEKKHFIMYANDGSTVVYRNKIVQHLEDIFYRSKSETHSYGQRYCEIYCYYPEFEVGIRLTSTDTFREVDEIRKRAEQSGLLSPERFTQTMKDKATGQQHIKLSEIELLKYFDPSMVETVTEAREQYLAEREARRLKEQARRKAEQSAKAEQGRNEANKLIQSAIQTILHGGTLQNSRVTIYRSDDDYSTYSIINYLLREYGINAPLRTQGWINNKLIWCIMSNGWCTQYNFRKHSRRENGSDSFPTYMANLYRAIKASMEDTEETSQKHDGE